ncbi:hypothetical protein HYS79_00250 [Patescibacteria group bacterium]|nr:hypothetical protein [Patescibacteria group bacterium]
MERDEKDAVERLKGRLYDRTAKTDVGEERTALSKKESSVPTAWSDVHARGESEDISIETPIPMAKKTRSVARTFLISSMLFFVGASAVAAFMFFGGGNLISPQNIDIEIVAPSLVDGGKEASFQILVQNRNQTALQLVDLVVDYPGDTRSPVDPTEPLAHERISIGTIASGEQIKRTVSGLFYGNEGAQEKVLVTLEYSVAGSNAVFQKKIEQSFVIGSSPVSLTVRVPAEAVAGEQFPIDIEVRANAPTSIATVAVEARYPFGFSPVSTSPKAAAGGSTLWMLGTMAPGSTKTIHIVGTIDGQDGDERIFRFLVGSNTDATDPHVTVPFLEVPQTLTVRLPFISGTISVAGQSGKAIAVVPGAGIKGVVTWKNNLPDSVANLELALSFAGPALDGNSISAVNGFYQSANSSIIWTKDQEPTLAQVPPGGGGALQFSFSSLLPGANNVLITNPTIELNLTVKGTRVGDGGASETVSSVASAEVRLASVLSLLAEARHFTGPFVNSGPMPPRAESPTTYTIMWTVKNPTNTVANASVSTVLPPYIEFVAAQPGNNLTYDSASRTVRWTIGDIKAGTGYTLAQNQAAFQVRFTPSTSQVGTAPLLTGGTLLSGQDRFAQVAVQASAPAPTTSVAGESGFVSGMDIVAPK